MGSSVGNLYSFGRCLTWTENANHRKDQVVLSWAIKGIAAAVAFLVE